MTTRTMFFTAALVLAGAAYASSSSSVPPSEERILESGTPASPPYLDLRDCNVNSKAITNALMQVPDDERGKVEATSGCEVASDEAVPTEVDARYRR